eukprot:scaffold125435_cov57-Phaeocystis_antarctica.AAC.2
MASALSEGGACASSASHLRTTTPSCLSTAAAAEASAQVGPSGDAMTTLRTCTGAPPASAVLQEHHTRTSLRMDLLLSWRAAGRAG